jgi:hypothetical protein
MLERILIDNLFRRDYLPGIALADIEFVVVEGSRLALEIPEDNDRELSEIVFGKGETEVSKIGVDPNVDKIIVSLINVDDQVLRVRKI